MPLLHRVFPCLSLSLLAFAAAAPGAWAQDDGRGEKVEPAAKAEEDEKSRDRDQDARPAKPKIEHATFGGGCFWCVEAVFERIPGVKSVVSGYSGGHVPNPTYEMISTGLTGHAEVIQIEYDANVVPFEKLLEMFWLAHDPTTLNAQGPDHGPQYRSIILYHNEAQKEAAESSIREHNARRRNRSPIVTQVVPFEAFFPAEEYHQDFARNNPNHGYVRAYIVPKLRKFKSILESEGQADGSAREGGK